MTHEHPSAAAYRQTTDAFRAGDFSRLEALIDPDVLWHVPCNPPRTGDIRGSDAVVAGLAGRIELDAGGGR
jgi:hypothetical protein